MVVDTDFKKIKVGWMERSAEYSVRGWKVPLKYYVSINRIGINLVKSLLEKPLREHLYYPLMVALPKCGYSGSRGLTSVGGRRKVEQIKLQS